jgi:2-methylcitrate dehydratase
MTVAHYIPWRAIRAGKQLSDSKGASAAISTEVAIQSIIRAMKGFIGPKDIFRNPESVFRYNQPTQNDESPFDIVLGKYGDDFSVMGMHFKLGLYEHQSAGAISGVLNLLKESPTKVLANGDASTIESIIVKAYEPAYGIIGDPAKKDPKTRQSADHSMAFIIASTIRKALENHTKLKSSKPIEEFWKKTMLVPDDYSAEGLKNPITRELMAKIVFEHGGPDYDAQYPSGIPTSVQIKTSKGKLLDSGMVLFPPGHAKCQDTDSFSILKEKHRVLGELALNKSGVKSLIDSCERLDKLSNEEMTKLYECKIKFAEKSIDD